MSEFEKLRITNFYHGLATGDLNKRIEVLMLLKRMYPRDLGGGRPTLPTRTFRSGNSIRPLPQARESISINPNFAPAHRALSWAAAPPQPFCGSQRCASRKRFSRSSIHPISRSVLYQLAFVNGDAAGMQQQLDWASGRPDEYLAFDWQAGAAAFAGQWRKAQELSRRAIDLAAHGDTKEVAAGYAAEQALRLAVLSSNFSLPPPRQAQAEA